MSMVITDDIHYKNIASKIRGITGTDDTIYPADMANKVDDIFDFGRDLGTSEGYTEGYINGSNEGFEDGLQVGTGQGIEQGKQAERLRRWNIRQDNGNRTSFVYGFAGAGWTEETFDPIYDMRITNANYMFGYSAIKVDLVEHLEKLGTVMDFTNNAGYNNSFYQTDFIRLGVVGFSINPENPLNSTFANSEFLETIDLLKIGNLGKQNFANTFVGCTALKNITIEGVIGRTFQIQYSPLTVESMKSIIEHLKNYKGTSSDLTYTVKFSADCWTALEATTPPDGYDSWKSYVSDGLGWNY